MTSENDMGAAETPDSAGRRIRAVVGPASEFIEGEMQMARVGERRVVVIRTASGIHALDNACPHQGYGLATGTLDGELLTCQWHNWKFRVDDGRCTIGEENVACHQVDVIDGMVSVTVTEPTDAEAREALWPSLRRGIGRDYVGQMARDTARLLRAGATPEDIVWEGVALTSPKVEYGMGHGMAMATDCLTISDLYNGEEKTLPILQALSGLSEPTRDRPPWPLPAGDPSISLPAAIESEDIDAALASTVGQLENGAAPRDMLNQYIDAISRHHLNYGHGAIYTQKAFELLERAGWDRAIGLLPWLTFTMVFGTREDTLPYMRKAMREIEQVDLEALASAPERALTGWSDDNAELRNTLLDSAEAAIDACVRAAHAGAGVTGILDTVSLAVSERLLRYDAKLDFDHREDFGWLDITHGLTYARAARWVWERQPSAAAARLALFTAFLAHDTGRAERRLGKRDTTISPRSGDLVSAVVEHRADDAASIALGGEPAAVGDDLVRMSLMDRAGSFIVVAHVIKLAQAAREEATATGSSLPLAAAARFAAAPRLERFVARNAAEATAFVRTGAPPKR